MCEMLAIDMVQITSKANRSQPQPVAPTLNESGEVYALGFRWVTGGDHTTSMPVSKDGIMPTLDVVPPAVLTSSTAGSRARTSAWPVSGPVLGESAAVSGLSSTGCCANCGHDGQLLRMSSDSYPAIKDVTSGLSLKAWKNSGSVVSPGRYWTRKTSESRNAAAACSLSQVLQDEPASKYSLSAKAAAGILRRAERRGKTLPPALASALSALAEQQPETTPE